MVLIETMELIGPYIWRFPGILISSNSLFDVANIARQGMMGTSKGDLHRCTSTK